jgi:hypothetical protein
LPAYLNLSIKGILKGASGFLSGRTSSFKTSSKHWPLYQPSWGKLGEEWTLRFKIESNGTNLTLVKPQLFYKKGLTLYLIWLNLF